MKSLKQLRQRSLRQLISVIAVIGIVWAPLIQADNLYFVHTDHLGTPQVITDDNQQVVWQGDKNPFGETEVTVNQIEFNVRFPGQYYDAESGLHYNYFRDYDPGLGRYVQSDPIGLDGGINTYAYVDGNPLTYTDPTGEAAIASGASAGAGTAAAGGTSAGAAIGRLLGMGLGTALYPNSLGNDDQFYPDPPMCYEKEKTEDDDDKKERQKNCLAVYNATLQYCAGIPTMKEKQRCWEAAKGNYEACMAD